MEKETEQLNQLIQATNRLEEVLKEPVSSIIKDSAIQRFEFCMDLTWKTLKTFLETNHGIIVKSPKETFKESYKVKMISFDNTWIEFVDLRNNTVHTYNEKLADLTFIQLPKYLELIKTLIITLQSL